MRIGKNKDTLGIFIDEANIYHSQKTLGWKIDYQKLKLYFKEYGNLSVLNFYTSYQDDNKRQTDFLKKLKQYGYKIISKKLKLIKNKDGNIIKKGNLDMELALDAYRLQDNYNTFILFSGDSDFAYLIDLLKKQNKNIIIFSTAKNISRELIEKSNHYIDIKKMRDIFEYFFFE